MELNDVISCVRREGWIAKEEQEAFRERGMHAYYYTIRF